MQFMTKVIMYSVMWVYVKKPNQTMEWGKCTYILSESFGPKSQPKCQTISSVAQVGGLVGLSRIEINQKSRSASVWTNSRSFSRSAMVRCSPSTPLCIAFFFVFFCPFLFLCLCICNLFSCFPRSRKSLKERRHCSDGSAWENTISDHGCTWISLLQVKRFSLSKSTEQIQRTAIWCSHWDLFIYKSTHSFILVTYYFRQIGGHIIVLFFLSMHW